MTKIIKVETCGQCPYRAYPDMECTRTMNPVESVHEINDDCPLNDYIPTQIIEVDPRHDGGTLSGHFRSECG